MKKDRKENRKSTLRKTETKMKRKNGKPNQRRIRVTKPNMTIMKQDEAANRKQGRTKTNKKRKKGKQDEKKKRKRKQR